MLTEGQEVTARILEVDPVNRRMRLSLAARPEGRPERGERRERKGGKNQKRAIKESAGYEDDSPEGMYNSFAEAFKGTEWEKE